MNDISEEGLHDLLATRVAGLVPGQVPTERVLAGARRRRVRVRVVTATAGLLAVAGAATVVAAERGSAGGVTAAGKPSATKTTEPKSPKAHIPVITRQLGLAPGQKASGKGPTSGMQVLMSGTVDGQPWQLYGAAQVDPPENGMWADHAPADPGKHVYCFMFGVDVGGKQRNAGGGGCGQYDLLNDPSHDDPIWFTAGGDGIPADGTFVVEGVVAPEVAKLVWTGPDGFSEETAPMVTPLAKLPLFFLSGSTPGKDDKITAYDAAGKVVATASFHAESHGPAWLWVDPPYRRY